MDISGSLILMILLSWLFVLIPILYVVMSTPPILFPHVRIGKHCRTFTLLKFRTLRNDEGPVLSRRFLLGNLLRATSLDELPQLWNVLKGDMSLIGPRPLPVSYLPLFSEDQQIRHEVRPGITGWAQVNGRNSISWQRKFQYDVEYVRNISFWLDCKIVIKTIILLLSFKKDTSLYEEKFSGNNDQ